MVAGKKEQGRTEQMARLPVGCLDMDVSRQGGGGSVKRQQSIDQIAARLRGGRTRVPYAACITKKGSPKFDFGSACFSSRRAMTGREGGMKHSWHRSLEKRELVKGLEG